MTDTVMNSVSLFKCLNCWCCSAQHESAIHMHILSNTHKYEEETKRIVVQPVNHEGYDDRTPTGELQNGFVTTVVLWEKTHCEKYEDCDTNYKGALLDCEKLVFCDGRKVMVHGSDVWSTSFMLDAVNTKCKTKTADRMNYLCRQRFMDKVRIMRGAQVLGRACAAMCNYGFIVTVQTLRRLAVPVVGSEFMRTVPLAAVMVLFIVERLEVEVEAEFVVMVVVALVTVDADEEIVG